MLTTKLKFIMLHTKTYTDANGETYTDTLKDGKLVKRELRDASTSVTWERKGSSWLCTCEDKWTGEFTTEIVPYPPTPTYPLASEGGEQVQVEC